MSREQRQHHQIKTQTKQIRAILFNKSSTYRIRETYQTDKQH